MVPASLPFLRQIFLQDFTLRTGCELSPSPEFSTDEKDDFPEKVMDFQLVFPFFSVYAR